MDLSLDPDSEEFNVNGKTPWAWRTQLRHSGPPVQIANFLSADEIKLLLEVERTIPQERRELRYPDERITITHGPWLEDHRAEFLRERLATHFGHFEVWGGNYFDISWPYLPHVDNGNGIREANFKNFVFPLELEPAIEEETYLVFFKQRYFGDNTGFYRNGRGLDRAITANGSLTDYSRVLGLESEGEIDASVLGTTLAHIEAENLRGFSVECLLPWRVGSCIAFDSSQIHCAEDFRRRGLRRKRALSLFTRLPGTA